MRRWLELWPLLATLTIVWPLNTWSVVGNLRGWGILTGWSLFMVSIAIANLELCYWWWFWGWLGRSIQKLRQVQKSVDFAKQLSHEAWRDPYVRWRYLERVKNHFIGLYDQVTDPRNWIIRCLRWGGHGMIFLMGIEPFIPGARVAGVFFCRTTKSKSGFGVLLIANIIHVTIVIWSWEQVLVFFQWLRQIFY